MINNLQNHVPAAHLGGLPSNQDLQGIQTVNSVRNLIQHTLIANLFVQLKIDRAKWHMVAGCLVNLTGCPKIPPCGNDKSFKTFKIKTKTITI